MVVRGNLFQIILLAKKLYYFFLPIFILSKSRDLIGQSQLCFEGSRPIGFHNKDMINAAQHTLPAFSIFVWRDSDDDIVEKTLILSYISDYFICLHKTVE